MKYHYLAISFHMSGLIGHSDHLIVEGIIEAKLMSGYRLSVINFTRIGDIYFLVHCGHQSIS